MKTSITISQQIKQNLLAIISILIAISALSYNSWRNEQSEENRNIRSAGFEIMREAAKLQLLIDVTTYASSKTEKDLIQGWVSINLILALSELMAPQIKLEAEQLKTVWSKHWEKLSDNQNANKKVSDALTKYVFQVKELMISLQ